MCIVGESMLLKLLWPCEFMNILAAAGRFSSR